MTSKMNVRAELERVLRDDGHALALDGSPDTKLIDHLARVAHRFAREEVAAAKARARRWADG